MINIEIQPEFEIQKPFLSKGEYVFRLLKEKIVNGYLERNKVYTIVETAESLGVSRTPVGEAVKILASKNYVTLSPGVGFKIKELTMADIRETLLITGALEELILRKIVEDGIQPTEKLKDSLKQSWLAVKENIPSRYTKASADFHRALSEMADLPKVNELLNENILAHEIYYCEGVEKHPRLIIRLIEDHTSIVDLVRTGAKERIPGVIQTHVENCVTILTRVIKQ